jgi:hypothetical protein
MKNITALLVMVLAMASLNQMAIGQISNPNRFVQIRSLDFTTSVIELHNFGEVDRSLSGWRFCSHDEDQDRRYTNSGGLNGIVLGPGQSLFIHINNDASPLDPNSINRSQIGGNFALPFDTDGAYAIQIYWQTPFGTGTNIADHVQISTGGNDNTSADERSDEAQSGGVWDNQNLWVNVQTDTESVVLQEAVALNELHGPDDYDVNNPVDIVLGDVNCDGLVNLLDISPFVDAISAGQFDPKADMNQDGLVNLIDVQPFVDVLSGG